MLPDTTFLASLETLVQGTTELTSSLPPATPAPVRYALAAFDALSASIAILDASGMIVSVNRAWQTFGTENGSLHDGVGTNYLKLCEDTRGEEQAMASQVAQAIRESLAGYQGVFELEYPCDSPKEKRHFVVRVTAFEQDGGRYAVVAHENITRRIQAELEVKRLNAQLEARVQERTADLDATRQQLEQKNRALEIRNEDMARYAYIASHDLQEPLRILGAYADMLRERYRGRLLDQKGDKYLDHIVEQATRARQLVRDTLVLTSVVEDAPRRALNIRTIFDEIAGAQQLPAGSRVECRTDLQIYVNVMQVRQLLSNLLSNAVKFRSDRPLTVSLTGSRRSGWAHFEMRDNGVGIEPEHAERVFAMFQRLHNRREVAGNGIGLTVCQRVVAHHGGEIWIEPRPQGLAVHFTLPLAQEGAERGAAEPEG